MEINNFAPRGPTLTKVIAPTATSQRIAISGDPYQGCALYVYNASSLDVAIKGGDVTVVAVLPTSVPVTGDLVIPSGGTMIITLSAPETYVAAIASGTASGVIYFTPGDGN